MAFDPSGAVLDKSTAPTPPDDTEAPPSGFDPRTLPPVPRSAARKPRGDPTGGWLGEASGFARGVGRGLAGDLLGVSQLVSDLGVPVNPGDPVQNWLKRTANAPSANAGETAGRVVGGVGPFLFGGELPGAAKLARPVAEAVRGGIAGALQPTQSGSLASHAAGAAGGGAAGFLLGSVGGPAQEAMRKLGVRLTPGRLVPGAGREWERFLARLPILNRLIGHGRQVSLGDFQHALYNDALETLPDAPRPTATGSAGLAQLRTTITTRLNDVILHSSLPPANVQAFDMAVADIKADAIKDPGMGAEGLRKLAQIIKDDVDSRVTSSEGLTGAQLAGKNGVIARLNARSREYWRSDNTENKAIAHALDRVEEALLDNAEIGAGGRPALAAARQAYARYKTLQRAASGTKAEGYVDPDSLLGELRRQNRDLFTEGGMRLQPMARAAREAGVPNVAETRPDISPWEIGLLGGLAHYGSPDVLYGLPPALLYNRPGMSAANWLAGRAGRAVPFAGTATGQAISSLLNAPGQPPTTPSITPGGY